MAAKFVPAVVAIAVAVFVFWIVIGYTVLDPTKIEHGVSPPISFSDKASTQFPVPLYSETVCGSPTPLQSTLDITMS